MLGHPFGRVPVSRPFDANQKEAEIILSDPANPVGKDIIAGELRDHTALSSLVNYLQPALINGTPVIFVTCTIVSPYVYIITHAYIMQHTHTHTHVTALGYSTKVYFNACCKPSPLFDPNRVLSSLPFCLEAGFLADNTQKVLQLFLDLSKDPVASLEVLPEGDGPALIVKTSDDQVVTRKCPAPQKLSDYWSNLYKYASLLECCENFLSASIPSAPCLLCHPFGKLH